MKPDDPLEKFSFERNLSENTIRNYNSTILDFEKIIGKNIKQMLNIAKKENKNINLEWEDTQLYSWLIKYRNHLYKTHKVGAADIKFTRVKAIFRHYKILLGDLPYFSRKQVKQSDEIDYEDLPTRNEIKDCMNSPSTVLKPLTLLMVYTGISRKDASNLQIKHYLKSTYDYQGSNNIYTAIKIMRQSQISVIPMFKLRRIKTGETYRTFAGPEFVDAMNTYLLSREDDLTLESKLFDIDFRYINDIFKTANDKYGLGTINGRCRFSPQMLRSYHATKLSEAGMNDSYIDLLQGRKPQSIARKSYIRVKREKLKEEYIKCLPFLAIEEIEKVRTELDIVKDEKGRIQIENNILKTELDKMDGIMERLSKLEEKN